MKSNRTKVRLGGRWEAARWMAGMLVLGGGGPSVWAAASIVLLNANWPGEGFNDPTPVEPVGGNPGITVGEQRQYAFQYAAAIWGAHLHSSETIEVFASFESLPCSSETAVLGTTGSAVVWSDFPGATHAGTWYGSALANRLAGFDLDPFYPDIWGLFNADLGRPGCLDGVGWYHGLDGNHGSQMDLVTVFLHELAHGLGFQQFTDLTTGERIEGLSDAYGRNLVDRTLGKSWDEMSDAERAFSAGNARRLVWDGAEAKAAARGVLEAGTPLMMVNAPGTIAGDYPVGLAWFGPALTTTGVTGELVLAEDGVDLGVDGCSPFLNDGAVSGRIAVVVRGGCDFTEKALNAQRAGALGLVVIDDVPGSPPADMGGEDAAVTIPSVRISLGDGWVVLMEMIQGPVNVTLGVASAVYRGMDRAGGLLVHAPDPVLPGTSITHLDPVAFRDQLMEPYLEPGLTHSLHEPEDLTVAVLRDLGWFPDWGYSKYDLDGSGCVDRTDLNRLNTAIRSRSKDPAYDLNLDGRVDIADARLLSLRFSRVGGVPCTGP